MEQAGDFERDGVRMVWSARTDVGKRRRLNEDSLVAEPGLFAVADGMGGHAAGDVASQLVTDRLQRLATRLPLAFEDVSDVVDHANREVRERAHRDGTGGMGTTLVAAVLVDNGGDDAIVVINVGDSRCYLLDDAGLRIVTHDHSLVQELIDAGELAPELADRHPKRNVVTRAIGTDDNVVPDYVVLEPAAWQRLLLCSDGVSGQISTAALGSALQRTNTPDEAVTEILDVVLSGRAPDNATAIVVDVERGDLDDEADITGPRARALAEDDADITGPARARRVGRSVDLVPSGVSTATDLDESSAPETVISAVPTPEPGSVEPTERAPMSPISEVPK